MFNISFLDIKSFTKDYIQSAVKTKVKTKKSNNFTASTLLLEKQNLLQVIFRVGEHVQSPACQQTPSLPYIQLVLVV